MQQFEAESKKPIFMVLSSEGGDAYVALAFAARMRVSACPLHLTAYGEVSSAAVLVLAAATTRRLARESWVMVHEDSGEIEGTVVEMEREAKQHRRMEDQWAMLLEERTGTSASIWTDLHKATTYLTPAECLELGLIHEVI